MKNPDTMRGVGAFRVTSTATLASPVDATPATFPANEIFKQFVWCNRSNSVQPWNLTKRSIDHD